MRTMSPHLVAATAQLHGWLFDHFDPPNWVKGVLYTITWLIVLAGLYIIFVWYRKRSDHRKWTTQDIFILAILSVLLLAWDTFLNDQLFGPLVTAIPVAGNFLNWIQLPDLPYMFIVMVAVATIRKPGVVTTLIFVKRILTGIMFTTHGVNIPDWPDALDEGIFADLYIMARGDQLLSDMRAMLIDGFVIGFLRGGPNVLITCMVLDPFLNGTIHTWGTIIGTNLATGGGVIGNALGNGLEAAIVAPLAVQVARSVGVLGHHKGRRHPVPATSPTLATVTAAGPPAEPAGGATATANQEEGRHDT
jgi:hypothetical protein